MELTKTAFKIEFKDPVCKAYYELIAEAVEVNENDTTTISKMLSEDLIGKEVLKALIKRNVQASGIFFKASPNNEIKEITKAMTTSEAPEIIVCKDSNFVVVITENFVDKTMQVFVWDLNKSQK